MKFTHILAMLAASVSTACMATDQGVAPAKGQAAQAAPEMPVLVHADGSYPTVPLAKDKVVVKVLQTTVDSLSDFPTIEEGLDHNLSHMEEIARKACTTGKKPDFLLFHEFPLKIGRA